MLIPGFTFLSRNPQYVTEHLYIIISPVIDEKVLFVNVTTRKEFKDDTCILKKGDHDFIRHESVINYADATESDVSLIREAIANKIFKPHTPVRNDVLDKIQKGAYVSPAFPPKYLKYIPRTK
jgi:hypothetical protein